MGGALLKCAPGKAGARCLQPLQPPPLYCPPCRYGAQLAPVLLEACGAADPDLRQCSVYGLGVLAAKAPDTFRPLAAETLKRLAAIVQHPEARGEGAAD